MRAAAVERATHQPTCFQLIQQEIVELGCGGGHDLREPRVVAAHRVGDRNQAGRLGLLEHMAGAKLPVFVELVQLLQQSQIAEIENTRRYLREIEVLRAQHRIGSGVVEKSPST